MSYQILPNLIFILAIFGILVMVLRRLPEAAEQADKEPNVRQLAAEHLASKGLPAVAISKIKSLLKFWGKKIWHFALEAKDLRPQALAGYRIRKIWGQQPAAGATALPAAAEARGEEYFLETIKNDPKNLANYDALGKYYLENQNIEDAKNTYQYLTQHDPANADYQARVAYCFYKQNNLPETAAHYQKSIALDSTQPNRYYNLGLVLEMLGQTQNAWEAVSKAAALEPKNARYYVTLSTLDLKLDRPIEALTALQKAHHLDPENTEVKQKLDKLIAPKVQLETKVEDAQK